MYSIHKNPIGIYEKALPNSFTWEEKFKAAKKAGFDYMEISIDTEDFHLEAKMRILEKRQWK